MNPVVEFVVLLALLHYLEITGFWWWATVIASCILWLFLAFIVGLYKAIME
jgi:hypothetical protein